MMKTAIIGFLCVATASAFVAPHKKALPAARVTRAPTKAAMTMEDTSWEGEAPPSYVLGNLQNAPSALLGPVSGIFLLVGLYCVAVRPPRVPIFFFFSIRVERAAGAPDYSMIAYRSFGWLSSTRFSALI